MTTDPWSSWGGSQPAFVGRDGELRALNAALARGVRFAAPQFVTVLGPLGIGKSRLLDEWVERVEADDRYRVLRARARRGAAENGLTADLLRARFAIDEAEPENTARAAFRSQLEVVFGDRRVGEVAGLMGRFLGLELGASPLGTALAARPAQQALLARTVLYRFLEEDALIKPLVLVIDDLHAADDESMDLLGALATELGEAPLVVIAAARPELLVRRPEWGRGAGSHVRLELGPLAAPDVGALLSTVLTPSLAASPELIERVSGECGGNPHRLAQVLSAYREQGILLETAPESWRFDAVRARQGVGISLPGDEAAHARVAALTRAERDLLARASTFGATFWTGGVIALGRMGGQPLDPTTVFAPDPGIEEVRRLLAQLEERGYLERTPESVLSGESQWLWRSVEERQILSCSVDPELQSRRRLFAAQWLEGRTAVEDSSERFELLAELYAGGGDARRAGECFVAAGARAAAEPLLPRAHTLYARGVELLDLDDSVFKMDALHKLGDVAARTGRTREALAHFAEMLRIAWRLDLPAKGGAAHARIGRLHRTLGDFALARKHLELGRLLFELADDSPGVAATLDDLGRVHHLLGEQELALSYHRSALELRESLRDERGRAMTLSWMGLCEATMGAVASANELFRAALTIYRQADDQRGMAYCMADLALIEREAGRPDRALQLLVSAREATRERGELLQECQLSLKLAECLLHAGREAEAERELELAREAARRFGARPLLGDSERQLGEVKLARGQAAAARDHAEAALDLGSRMSMPLLTGAALRVMAAARGSLGASDPAARTEARGLFERALEVQAGVGAELELARTCLAFAYFEERLGGISEAAELRARADRLRERALDGVPHADARAAE